MKTSVAEREFGVNWLLLLITTGQSMAIVRKNQFCTSELCVDEILSKHNDIEYEMISFQLTILT